MSTPSSIKLTPLKVTLLLHIASIAAPIPDETYPAQQEALEDFVIAKLIAHANCECGYVLTFGGLILVRAILETTIPVQKTVWVNPDTNEILSETV